MKITILHGSNDRYGASRVLVDEVLALERLSHSITIVVPSEGPLKDLIHARGLKAHVYVDPNLRVLRFSDLRGSIGIPRLPSPVLQADLTVLWTLALANYAPVLRMKRIPMFVSVHELIPNLVGSVLVRTFLGGRYPIQACSNAVKTWLVRCGVDSRRVVVSSPIFYLPAVRHRVGPERFTVGVVGRVNGHKGHLQVVAAFQDPELRSKRWALELYGSPFPGQERHLSALLEAAEVDDRVTYMSEASELSQIAGRLSVVASFPSRPEPFGLVPVEAWEQGVMSVGYGDGGASEVLSSVGGVLVERRDGSIKEGLLRAEELWRQGKPLPTAEAVLATYSEDRRIAASRRLINAI